MFRKINKKYEYKFSVEKRGIYKLTVEASCQSGKILGLFGGSDLRVEIDDYVSKEIPAEKKKQYYNIPPSWNGTKLKGLNKIVVFVLDLKKGEHTINLIPKREVIIEKEPEIKLLDTRQAEVSLLNNIQARESNRRPWITIALINLPLKILGTKVVCQKKNRDIDDVKVIINGKIQKNRQSSWWGKNWYWRGSQLKGNESNTRFYPLLKKGIHYIELWADRMPVLNELKVNIGEIVIEDTEDKETDPTVDNPYYTSGFEKDSEQLILARAIFGEARSLSEEGRIAVGWSIKNRVKDKRWADNYHDVILQAKQYSAFNEEDINRPLVENPLLDETQIDEWYQCYEIAGKIINNETIDPTNGANHYYSDYISTPSWANSPEAELKIKIDNTYFYYLVHSSSSGFAKIAALIIIISVIIILFTGTDIVNSDNKNDVTYKHFFIHPVSQELSVMNFDQRGYFLGLNQITDDGYNKSHLNVFSNTQMLGYFQALHKKGEMYNMNDEESKKDYYNNYIALMIKKNDTDIPYEVYRGSYHTSRWEWENENQVIVYYNCGTECMYAYEIDINGKEVIGEYHVD